MTTPYKDHGPALTIADLIDHLADYDGGMPIRSEFGGTIHVVVAQDDDLEDVILIGET